MDRAKPQQDVQQLYRIAASVQSQRLEAQIENEIYETSVMR